MVTLMTTVATRVFDSGSELSSLNVNDGWSVSGGQAVSSSTTMAGSTKRFMLDYGLTWAGSVEADVEIQDKVGLCISVPTATPDNGYGVYFGIFLDAVTGGYYFKLWAESQSASTPWRDAKMDFVTETPCAFPAGQQVTFVLGARTSGWYVSANGKSLMHLLAPSSDRTGTPVNARGGTRLGVWATRSGATINRMKTSTCPYRAYPSSLTTVFSDNFMSQTANAIWDPALATVQAQSPFGAGSGSGVGMVNGSAQLVLTGAITLLSGDTSYSYPNDFGIEYYATFQYLSGTVSLYWNFGAWVHVTVNGSVSGTSQGIQIWLPSDGKSAVSYLEFSSTSITSSTYIQVRVHPQWSAATTGTGYSSAARIAVYSSTSSTGPWALLCANTANVSLGYHQILNIATDVPSSTGTVDNVKFEWGPATTDAGGSWAYDYVQAEGPVGAQTSTTGLPAFLYRGGDLVSRIGEAN